MRNKKLLTSAVALGLAVVLLLGGTFAWQSISQTAENETANIVNPGGRLHDDFDGSNKDVYVENFGDEPIFARVRLEEYFALVINQGTAFANTETKLGNTSGPDGEGKYTYTGAPYIFSADKLDRGDFLAGLADGEYHWSWTVGSADSADAYYMPTFNKNKDSLVADVNGWYENGIGAFGVATEKELSNVVSKRDGTQYVGNNVYKAGDPRTANAIYDIDRNSVDELAALSADTLNDIIENATPGYDTNAVKLVEEEHYAKKIGTTKGLISMEEWLTMVGENGEDYDPETHGGYWVYDTDGWVYWSAPIQPGTTTGLLLDGITLNGVMDDSWYYAINVVAQFVTADDLGKADSTGFYDTEAAGENPITDSAEKLLGYITGDKALDYAPGEYAVIYDFSDSSDTPGYTAYYVSANSAADARDRVRSMDDDRPDSDIVYCGRASRVSDNSKLAGNIKSVQLGGVSKGFSTIYTRGEVFTLTPTDMSGWFKNFGTELDGGVGISSDYLDTSNVTNMANCFQNVKFAKEGTISIDRDTGETQVNRKVVLDLSGWDTSRVTTMRSMFDGCANLEELTLGDGWDIGSVTDMSYMFRDCSSLTLHCYNWGTGSYVDMTDFNKNANGVTISAIIEPATPYD